MMWFFVCFLSFVFGLGIEGHEQSTNEDATDDWMKYPAYEYFPLFRQTAKDIVASDAKLKILFDLMSQTVGNLKPMYFNFPPDQNDENQIYHILTDDEAVDRTTYDMFSESEDSGPAASECNNVSSAEDPDQVTGVHHILSPEEYSDQATDMYRVLSIEDSNQAADDYTLSQSENTGQATSASPLSPAEDTDQVIGVYHTLSPEENTDQETNVYHILPIEEDSNQDSEYHTLSQSEDFSQITGTSLLSTDEEPDQETSVHNTLPPEEDTDQSTNMYHILSTGDAEQATDADHTLSSEQNSNTPKHEVEEAIYTLPREEDSMETIDRAAEVYYTLVPDQQTEESISALTTEDCEEHSTLERRVGCLYEKIQDLYSEVLPVTEATPDSSECADDSPLQVGSIRGIPGEHFPNYDDIPITSFTCADKKHVPGFYADLETGCQVFHVCWPHRRESFLCPIGTTFNQAILACDYWYSNNCSLAPQFFDVNEDATLVETVSPIIPTEYPWIEPPVPSVDYTDAPETSYTSNAYSTSSTQGSVTHEASEDPHEYATEDWSVLKFLPIKSKVVTYLSTAMDSQGSNQHTQPILKPKLIKIEKHAKHDQKKLVATTVGKEILKVAENAVKDVPRLIPDQKIAVTSKVKFVAVKPSEKLIHSKIQVKHVPVSAVKVKPHVKMIKVKPRLPTTQPIKKQPLPGLNPKFVLKPVPVKIAKAHRSSRKSAGGVDGMQTEVLKLHGKTLKTAPGHNVEEIVMRALEMTGDVLTRDILPLTRKALAQNYVKLVKTKKH